LCRTYADRLGEVSIQRHKTTRELALLIVSRDRRAVKRIRRLLSDNSWRRFVIRQADGIDTALKTLAREPADAVLLDLELPNDSGMQTLMKLRQALPGLPVIALGDYSNVGLGVLALRQGAQDVMPRNGGDLFTLVRSIRFAIERQRREHSLHEYIRELNVTQGQLHALLQTDADGHIVVDEQGTILYANPAAERLFGRDEADLRGSPFGFPVIGQDLAVIDLFRKGGLPVTVEMRVAQAQWDADLASVISLRDVTARLLGQT